MVLGLLVEKRIRNLELMEVLLIVGGVLGADVTWN